MRRPKNTPKLLVGITGKKENHWKNKLKEINKLDITEAALFLEWFKKTQRQKIYQALLRSKIKKIPLVHLRNDMDKSELAFLTKHFGSRYFTIHEDSFNVLDKWRGFYKNLFLEMNTDNSISDNVDIAKIGGFCIDLAHFKVEETKRTEEFKYIRKRKNSHYFFCNHLNGYSPSKNVDLHTIKNLKDFDYLKTLPKFLFGKVIALEIENSIAEQLKFKKYLSKLLDKI
jgi:hypothetical protein